MIKTILVGVACFLVALGASTSLIVMRTPRPVVAAGTTAVADSVVHATVTKDVPAGHDFIAPGEFAADAPLTTPDLLRLAEAIPHQAETVPATSRRAERVEAPADYGRVAKILVNMKPTEAAAILAYLSDAQVEGVLRALGPRQAATVLAALPTERAAQLSKRLLILPAEEKKP